MKVTMSVQFALQKIGELTLENQALKDEIVRLQLALSTYEGSTKDDVEAADAG